MISYYTSRPATCDKMVAACVTFAHDLHEICMGLICKDNPILITSCIMQMRVREKYPVVCTHVRTNGHIIDFDYRAKYFAAKRQELIE